MLPHTVVQDVSVHLHHVDFNFPHIDYPLHTVLSIGPDAVKLQSQFFCSLAVAHIQEDVSPCICAKALCWLRVQMNRKQMKMGDWLCDDSLPFVLLYTAIIPWIMVKRGDKQTRKYRTQQNQISISSQMCYST